MIESFSGLVIRATGSWYDVLHDGVTHSCRIRGKMRLRGVRSTSPVVVGDVVRCELEPQQGSYVICDVEPRRNYIIRRASNLSKESHIIAANIDEAMIVVTLFSPTTATEFIDRFLVTCEAYKIPATILLAKIDLCDEHTEAVAEFKAIYGSAGYEVLELSATKGIGVEEIKRRLCGKTTLISGNSGVGKSTLIGAIEPTIEVKTGEISQSHHKGKHTTTFSTIYPLSGEGGGYIIDTPGIKGFGLLDIEDDELWHYYPEMLSIGEECGFYNCTHTHEPKCAVRCAVEEGRIAYSRYESYLKILDEDEKYRK